jgi:predicted component of viral defense system (DUF524 family)
MRWDTDALEPFLALYHSDYREDLQIHPCLSLMPQVTFENLTDAHEEITDIAKLYGHKITSLHETIKKLLLFDNDSD